MRKQSPGAAKPSRSKSDLALAVREARQHVKAAKQQVKLLKAQLKLARGTLKSAKRARAEAELAEHEQAKPVKRVKRTAGVSRKKVGRAKSANRRVVRAPESDASASEDCRQQGVVTATCAIDAVGRG